MGLLRRVLKRLRGRKHKAPRQRNSCVCPWGRTLAQYRALFQLSDADLAPGRRILDCGAGHASFAAEAGQLGVRVAAVDPLYKSSAEFLRREISRAHQGLEQQVRAQADSYVWGRGFDSPEHIMEVRRKSLELFLADFSRGAAAASRYACAALPRLPFANNQFDIALAGNVLFLYSEQLDERLHCASVLELLRLAPEVRIFPLLAMSGAPSPHLEPVMETVKAAGARAEVRKVQYELMKGGDKLLVIRR